MQLIMDTYSMTIHEWVVNSGYVKVFPQNDTTYRDKIVAKSPASVSLPRVV